MTRQAYYVAEVVLTINRYTYVLRARNRFPTGVSDYPQPGFLREAVEINHTVRFSVVTNHRMYLVYNDTKLSISFC